MSNTISILVQAKDQASQALHAIGDAIVNTGDKAKDANASLAATDTSINEVGESAGSHAKDIENFTKAFIFGNTIFSLVTDAARELKDQFVDVESESRSMQASMSQINTLLATTRDASGQSAQSISDLTEELSKNTPITKAAGLAATQMLLPFTNIGNQVFPQVLQLSADLATHLNNGLAPSADQVSSAAQQLGRALNDPSTGMTLLKRAGLSLTEQQIDQIKTMQSSGDTIGAQKQLLQDLSDTIGGSAAAAADTFSGRLQIMKNYFVDLGANGITFVQAQLNNLAKDWSTHQQQITDLTNRVANFLKPSLEALGNTIESKVFPILSQLWHQVIEPLLPVIGTLLVAAIWAVTNALNLLLQILTPVMNFLIQHKQAVIDFGLAFAALAVYMKFDDIKVSFLQNMLDIQGSLGATKDQVTDLFTKISGGTTMGAVGVAGALADIALVAAAVQSVLGAIDAMNNTYNAAVQAEASQEGAIAEIKAAYAAGKISQATEAKDIAAQNRAPSHALGTDFAPGGWTVLNEQGPEMVQLPTGSKVLPANKTKQMLGAKGPSIGNMTLNVYNNTDVKRVIRQIGWSLKTA